MINALPDEATVIANEVVPKRANILRENLAKWGFPNVTVTNLKTSELARLGLHADIIAVDAPCSGEGMMRKDPEAVAQWSPGLVRQCAALQREILADAVAMLRPGGYLIYSTCTFNRTENEEQVAWLVEEHGLEPVNMGFPAEWGIGAQLDSPYPALRFMSHLTRGEGLFAAVLRAPAEGALPAPSALSASALPAASPRSVFRPKGGNALPAPSRFCIPPLGGGTLPLGAQSRPWERNQAKRSPKGAPAPEAGLDPAAPLSLAFDRSAYPEVELDLDTALRYLRREALRLPAETPRGLVVVTYLGHPLGFVKNIGSRANNLYPSAWRIRN